MEYDKYGYPQKPHWLEIIQGTCVLLVMIAAALVVIYFGLYAIADMAMAQPLELSKYQECVTMAGEVECRQ